MDQPMITAGNVDLSNCDREQVQFSGAVQPHGCLLVIDEPSLAILQASANAGALLGIGHEALPGATLDVVTGARTAHIAARLGRETLDSGPVHLALLDGADTPGGRPLNLFAHRADGALLLEFEVIPAEAGRPLLDLYSELQAVMARLQATPTLMSLLERAVADIRHLTGFERVMAYEFLEDGSGRVVAEDIAEGLEPYLDLHYPASDIPAPGRRLFALSWLRHLPDAGYAPVPLVPGHHPRTGRPIDQSRGILRSVSAMYSGYVANMGVKATMVMPLMKEGRLWGLISAMHHSAPRHVPHEARMAAEFLAHMISLMLAAKEDAETLGHRLRSRTVLDHMMRALGEGSDIHLGLGGTAPGDGTRGDGDGGDGNGGDGNGGDGILGYIDAGGAAIVTEDRITALGATPPEPAIRALARWLAQAATGLVWSTDHLGEQYADAIPLRDSAAGVLAVRLSRGRPEFVLWFRLEQIRTVHWAGDPGKPVEVDTTDGTRRLRPRGSFAVWRQEVAGRSRPWSGHDAKAAADLHWAIVELLLARAEETGRLNVELRDSNEELDSFAYVASHDLKEPLRGIHHMATFLERGLGQGLDPDSRQQLETISRLTRRMDDLIESLLQYSRTGRVDLMLADCDLDQVLDDVLLALRPRLEEAGTRVRRPHRLPVVRADRVRVRELLTNLVSNAVKYNDKPDRWVEIGVEHGSGAGAGAGAGDNSGDGLPPAIYVRDNGIGIPERHFERIFQIFRRLHGRDTFGGGTGAGLTIARRIVERHGGRLWPTSEPGQGTTFHFTLQASGPR